MNVIMEARARYEQAEARRKAEEAKAEEQRQSLIIWNGRLPDVNPTVAVLEGLEGKGWHRATLTQAERDAAEKLAEEERTGTRPIPEPEF